MDFQIQESEPINVKYKDKVFAVTRPAVGYLRKFRSKLRDAEKPDSDVNEVDVMAEFCLSIGVPQEVIDVWDLREMSQLFKKLNEEEKKS